MQVPASAVKLLRELGSGYCQSVTFQNTKQTFALIVGYAWISESVYSTFPQFTQGTHHGASQERGPG